MTGRATVYDVARVAGVSIKTVSRVVNGSAEVAAPTRQRVLSAVEELSYVRNAFACSLRTGSGDVIGVVIVLPVHVVPRGSGELWPCNR